MELALKRPEFDVIEFSVKDKDTISHDFVAAFVISVNSLRSGLHFPLAVAVVAVVAVVVVVLVVVDSWLLCPGRLQSRGSLLHQWEFNTAGNAVPARVLPKSSSKFKSPFRLVGPRRGFHGI